MEKVSIFRNYTLNLNTFMLMILSGYLCQCNKKQIVHSTIQIPSISQFDLNHKKNSTFDVFFYSLTIKINAQMVRSNQYERVYFSSNYILQVFNNHAILCNSTDMWDISIEELQEYQSNFQIIILDNISEWSESLIISASYKGENRMRALKRSRIYSLTRNYKDPGELYVIKPYRQSLKSLIRILSGYISIIPYICPNYKMGECEEKIKKKAKEEHQQFLSNYYIMYSKISLRRKQIVEIDYCDNCYMVIYLECKIGECMVQLIFDRGSVIQVLPYDEHQSLKLKEGRFNSIKPNKMYNISLFSHSQIIYYNIGRLQQMYYSCQNYPTSYLRKAYAQYIVINIERVDKQKPVGCWFGSKYNYNKSQIYYTRHLPQQIQKNRKYPLKLGRNIPIVYHYRYKNTSNSSKNYYLNIKKCMDGPVNVKFYTLPDYEKIKNRKLELFERDKDISQWVEKKQARVINQYSSIEIHKSYGEYLTDYIIIEVIPDTYSFVILSLTQQPIYHEEINQRILKIIHQSYSETDNQNRISIQVGLQIHVQAAEQIKKKISIAQMNNSNRYYLEQLCPQIMLIQKGEDNLADSPRVIQTNRFIVSEQNSTKWRRLNVSLYSQSKYVGISLEIDSIVYFIVIEVKSKINLFYKFKWVLLLAFGLVLMIVFATFQLANSLHTK